MEPKPAFWFISTIALYSMALYNCYHVLGARRSPGACISWIWANLTLPVISVPLYWFLGLRRVKNYSLGEVNFSQKKQRLNISLEEDAQTYQKIFSGFGSVFQVLQSEVSLFTDGSQAFDTIFSEINKARQYILVQYYILRSDRLGQELKDLLIKKARQGVKVYLLYDHMGSFWLPKQYLYDLKQGGVRAIPFLKLFSLRKLFLVNYRNHRKLVTVDGEIAFTGGLNVGEEYAGSRFSKQKIWRDTHISVRGPTVKQMEAIFLADWLYSNNEDLSLVLSSCQTASVRHEHTHGQSIQAQKQAVLLIPSGPYDQTNIGMLLFSQMIHGCKQRLWVSSPYFVPDEALQQGLELAVRRGVDVRIIIPKRSEHKIVHWVTLSYAEQVQRSGVRILMYDKGFVHQKVFLIDDTISFIGTSNFDNRTLYLNFEMMVGIFDRKFNEKVASMFHQDFDDSHEFAPYSDRVIRKLVRLRANSARLLAPLL